MAEEFITKARRRLDGLRVGQPLDKCSDMSSLVDPSQWHRVSSFVEQGRAEGANVYQTFTPQPPPAMPPTGTVASSSSSVMNENDEEGEDTDGYSSGHEEGEEGEADVGGKKAKSSLSSSSSPLPSGAVDDRVMCGYPPTLVTGVQSTSLLVREEIFGPVATVQTFRTPDEGVALANNTSYGLGASVWSENIGLSLEVRDR